MKFWQHCAGFKPLVQYTTTNPSRHFTTHTHTHFWHLCRIIIPVRRLDFSFFLFNQDCSLDRRRWREADRLQTLALAAGATASQLLLISREKRSGVSSMCVGWSPSAVSAQGDGILEWRLVLQVGLLQLHFSSQVNGDDSEMKM